VYPKLAATGGSAMGVMRVPLGYNRTYAKLDGPLTESDPLKAIRAGRTFATSGPMLLLTANGLDVGSQISYVTDRSDPIVLKAGLRQAHTSPVYVEVDGKPTAARVDAVFMIRWIDRLVEVAHEPDRYETTAQRDDVLAIYQKARDIYEGIARQGAALWSDG
jgi:hypothetical protein